MASSGATDAALALAVLERERARMSLEDLRSWVAQRHWVGSLQVPVGRPMTWETAYRSRHNALLDAQSLLEEVRDLLRQNQPAAALERLLDELESEPAASEQAEEEELDDDSEVFGQQLLESVQFSATAPPLPFSGRCFRLDM